MMSSIFDVDSSSDSEVDVDYVPPTDELSSDEEEPIPLSDDEKETKKKPKGKQRNSDLLESKKTSTEGTEPVSTTVDEKKKSDDIYKSFLDEVAAEMKDMKNESVSSGISCEGSSTSSPIVSSDKNSCQSSSVSTPEQLFEFAGETIAVQDDTVKSVKPDSSSLSQPKVGKNSPASGASTVPPVKKRGLESVLGMIESKKQKLTVMQKSMLDWKSFKKDEGLDQELEKFNRGKGGFIERQRFLQKSDLRSYEIERDMRVTKRSTQAKRDT